MRLIPLIVVVLFFIACVPAQAIEINPSVDNQPFLCKYSLTKWIFCDTDVGVRGVNGTQGIQGIQGEQNFSAIYYNASNFTAIQNESVFQEPTEFTSYSNYSYFNGTVNLSDYAYLPGRAGGQLLQGGIASTDALTLNGSANNGNVNINPNGGLIGIGTSSPISSVVLTVARPKGVTGQVMEIYSSRDATGVTGSLNFWRDRPVVAANNGLQGINFYGNNSAGEKTLYGQISSRISSPTDGAEEGLMQFYTSTVGGFALNFKGTNIGIGTDAPTSMLDVTGSTRFRNCSGTPTMDAGGNMTCASDPKLKTAVQPYISDTAKVAAVSPIKYKWNSASGYDTTHTNTGFDAEQIKLVYPECVIAREDMRYEQKCTGKEDEQICDTVGIPTGTQTLALDDKCLIAVLWNAAKDQDLKIKALEAKVDKLLLVKP